MPRPISNPIPMMVAAMNLESIKDAASRGFHVQSTVLSGTKDLLLNRVNAFKEGCAQLDENEAREKTKLAYEYYKRFDNMFTGPGKVKEGNIEALPRKQTLEELKENLLICPLNEMIDKLSVYAEAGVDEVILSSSFGQSQEDLIESMYKIGENVIPYFKKSNIQVA